MSQRFEIEYEHELTAIRQLAREFAVQRPNIGGALLLNPNDGTSQDPHVERLIESFAYLTARVQIKLHDEFPELVDSLLGMLYPHYLAPIPSMAIAQLHLDSAQSGMTNKLTVERGTELASREINGLGCRFRTTAPADLWPLQVARARYQTSPFGTEITPPPESENAEAAIRIELAGTGGAPLTKLGCDRLRFFLSGDQLTTHPLYELLMNHVTSVLVRLPQAPPAKGTAVLPPAALLPVGFEEDEGLLPYGSRSFPGYRLLTEYFAFPQKFLFFDVTGLSCLASMPPQQEVELIFFLNRRQSLDTRIAADTFRLGCVPIVNLFSRLTEPIRLSRTKTQYLVVPDARRPQAMEVYSIDEVESIHPDTKESVRFLPFYSLENKTGAAAREAYWYALRRPSEMEDDSGTDVSLVLVDSHFEPRVPATDVLSIQATCTNRNLPAEWQKTGGVDWQFQLTGQWPIRRITTPVDPTPALRLDRKTSRWRVMSHLAVNHLSITGGPDAAAALRELLRLYDYSHSDSTAQQIDGLVALSCTRGVAPIREGHMRGFCRGLDVTVTFDDEKYLGTGFYLLASVLERFLGQYASINSFTRLAARSRQREWWKKQWAPRTGNLTLA